LHEGLEIKIKKKLFRSRTQIYCVKLGKDKDKISKSEIRYNNKNTI